MTDLYERAAKALQRAVSDHDYECQGPCRCLQCVEARALADELRERPVVTEAEGDAVLVVGRRENLAAFMAATKPWGIARRLLSTEPDSAGNLWLRVDTAALTRTGGQK